MQLDLFVSADMSAKADKSYDSEIYERVGNQTHDLPKRTDAELQAMYTGIYQEWDIARTRFAKYYLHNVLCSLEGEAEYRTWLRNWNTVKEKTCCN